MVSEQDIRRIRKMAAQIRKDVVLMIGGDGHVGHLGGSCSSADIVAALYFHEMKLDPKNPKWEDRDRFMFSKGHACIAQYAALAEIGYFSTDILPSLKSLGSILQGHPDRNKTPGVEVNTGSLGQGLSIAHGMALAMKLNKKDNYVYCIMGDGEQSEGQIWEAAMAAATFKTDNLIGILDMNGLQATGPCAERFDIPDLPKKWAAFGWNVIEIDGHDIAAIIGAFEQAKATKGRPSIVIAKTVKGKGISFAENVVGFHNGALTKEQYNQALSELDAQIASLS